jgi:hypothetical protein
VDGFALTANNITYGIAAGDLRYWEFFPCDRDGWGHIPVWGFAEVIASDVPELAVGRRVYGYLPMASHLTIVPGRIGPHGMLDMAAHRQPMSPIYNAYTFTDTDPDYRPEDEALIALYRPLFTTSFLLADFLAANDGFGARQIVLSSASSKTALGLAACLRQAGSDARVIGLTSAGNRAFVEALDAYDAVQVYGDVARLDKVPTAFVDMAGSGDLLRAVHGHFGAALKLSCRVGLTHREAAEFRIPDLPGPRPDFFFAPTYAQKRRKDWGAEGFGQRLSEAWHGFIGPARDWTRICRHDGPDAALARYLRTARGDIDPSCGDMLRL